MKNRIIRQAIDPAATSKAMTMVEEIVVASRVASMQNLHW
jgi:hypothetical protein